MAILNWKSKKDTRNSVQTAANSKEKPGSTPASPAVGAFPSGTVTSPQPNNGQATPNLSSEKGISAPIIGSNGAPAGNLNGPMARNGPNGFNGTPSAPDVNGPPHNGGGGGAPGGPNPAGNFQTAPLNNSRPGPPHGPQGLQRGPMPNQRNFSPQTHGANQGPGYPNDQPPPQGAAYPNGPHLQGPQGLGNQRNIQIQGPPGAPRPNPAGPNNGVTSPPPGPQSPPPPRRAPFTQHYTPNAPQYPWSQSSISNASPFPRYGHAANSIAARDGEVFVMGGLKGSNVFGDLWVIESGKLTISFHFLFFANLL